MITFPGIAHALGTTLYWCTATSSDFNTAANWDTNSNCSGGTQEVPATGDNLVFSDSVTSGDVSLNNDIPSLSLGSITFSGGSTTNTFTITGDSLTLSGGITDNGHFDSLDIDLTLAADQAFAGSAGEAGNLGLSSSPSAINTGTYTLTLSGGWTINDTFTGSGTITDNNIQGESFYSSSPAFTGTVIVPTESEFDYYGVDAFPDASLVTVQNGASLGVFSMTTSQMAMTLAEPLSLAGNGTSFTNQGNQTQYNGVLYSCLGNNPNLEGCDNQAGSSGTVLTLSGKVTLTANAEVYSYSPSGTFKLTGAYDPGSFSLTALTGNDTAIILPATGTLPASSTSTTTPKTPDTGLARIAGNPLAVLLVTMSAATILVFTSYRLKTSSRRS
jgi:hypothetical protein